MKVKDIVDAINFEVLAGAEGLDREVKGVYTCDLLSWVMSHGKQNNVWITVQIHPNIIAVATLLEFSCIIIPENIDVEEATLNKANNENIPVLQSNLNAYEICIELNKLGV
ncbi:MAG: AraC family transcriptional regulator [Caloramator sp.]|jgi:serine kinase of HPr protein (carbohydrate metabolism regulator)|uniref:DRTGG domain-containing protein n=1 Tax=Caloramator sp. TaxID=1871330 RepID=UPI001DF4A9FB|nr:DRTGG domain-containing protein [Caloramator sp.]MBZ4662645.1 AraC family transcriptional regulator [Caloramator sp.]